MLALLTRRGYWVEDQDTAYLQEPNPDEALGPLQAAACSYRIAMGPRAGRKAMSIRTLEARPSGEGTACVESNGFSLHAGVSCARGERKKLERLAKSYMYAERRKGSGSSLNDRLTTSSHELSQ